MRRRLLALTVALLAVGCSNVASNPPGQSPLASSSSAASPTADAPSGSPPPDTAIIPGGCGESHLYKGGEPAWLDSAGAHNNPTGLPYAVASNQTAAGFIFGYPLRAGHPSNPANKILWVVGFPREGSPLDITAQLPILGPAPVHQSEPADSEPGEIYPSIVDVPQAGCWRFELSWGAHHDVVYLQYR
jgi:hypothetical protein